jgi:endonuclease YncB( thermonuclease family)
MVAMLCLPINRAPAQELCSQANVVDGDTIELVPSGVRIRLFGIDAPESNQLCGDTASNPYRCGQRAAFALANLISRRRVVCAPHDRSYDRIVAVCKIGDIDLSDWMVRQGQALAYRRYSRAYVGAEIEAFRANRGVWAGAFKEPWDFRASQRARLP